MDTWKVTRHSGRNGDEAKVVYEGSEEKATAKYRKLEVALRQGFVKLINPDGEVVKRVHSARVRTRW